ncbi:MAG TPA: type II toxin-antitoxin system HicB family antitoxin [Stellaceae bacterium]|nr:type II toxin-antitoxin system HicB family antitoxin [Stellaceae bacterium]
MKRTRSSLASVAYPVQLDPEPEGGFTISFPDFFFEERGMQLSGGHSQADTREEALRRASDLLASILAGHLAEGYSVPEPSPAEGRPLVGIDPLTASKLELYRALYTARISRAELARRMGIAPQHVERLFDLDHASRLDQIEAAMRALGRRLVVTSAAA